MKTTEEGTDESHGNESRESLDECEDDRQNLQNVSNVDVENNSINVLNNSVDLNKSVDLNNVNDNIHNNLADKIEKHFVEPNLRQYNQSMVLVKKLSQADVKFFTKPLSLPTYQSTPKRRSSRIKLVPNRLQF